jgi:hypothetical protein
MLLLRLYEFFPEVLGNFSKKVNFPSPLMTELGNSDTQLLIDIQEE